MLSVVPEMRENVLVLRIGHSEFVSASMKQDQIAGKGLT